MITIKYFKEGDTLCASDFENKDAEIDINPDHIESMVLTTPFNRPLSGTFVDNYAGLTMISGKIYLMRVEEMKKLKEIISKE